MAFQRHSEPDRNANLFYRSWAIKPTKIAVLNLRSTKHDFASRTFIHLIPDGEPQLAAADLRDLGLHRLRLENRQLGEEGNPPVPGRAGLLVHVVHFVKRLEMRLEVTAMKPLQHHNSLVEASFHIIRFTRRRQQDFRVHHSQLASEALTTDPIN